MNQLNPVESVPRAAKAKKVDELTHLKKIFEAAFFDAAVYQRGASGRNVARLLSRLRSAGVDLSRTVVVSLQGPCGAIGKEQRWFLAEWSRHVFAVHNGYVLDLDFTSSPTILPMAEYMARQFLPSDQETRDKVLDLWTGNKVSGEIYERAFDASGYLKAESQWGQDIDGNFGTISLRQLVGGLVDPAEFKTM